MDTSKRKCLGCDDSIPQYLYLANDVVKNLRTRKYCLKCSPKRDRAWGKYSAERKEQITLSLYKRGLQRKEDLLFRSGGKCQSCGYNKCKRALSFHHRNREEKSFSLSLNFLWSKPWDVILQEHAKCDLLCLNCHAEIEDSLKDSNIVERVNKKYGTNF